MTVALVMHHSANMPGYKNNPDLEEVQSLTSYTQPMVSHNNGFLFSQPDPSVDPMSASWAAQHFQDFADNTSSHSGEAEEYIITSGQTTPRGSRLDRSQATENAWTAAGLAPISTGGHAMVRVDSSRSNGSSLSQSSQFSHMSFKGNASAFRSGSHSTGTMVGPDACLLPEEPQYWNGYPVGSGFDPVNGSFAVADVGTMHVDPSQMQFGPDSITDNASPGSWGFPVSRTPSPSMDEQWLHTQGPISPPNSSPEILCQSPTTDYNGLVKPEDVNDQGILPDGASLPSPLGGRLNGETARNHDLYKNALPQEDGLFHCPWEGHESCNHKPEKLKCNYDKFVDSHLKPYRCRNEACEGARFSSTACLLRHEREAHGLHGHGDKPFRCHYEGCERGFPGNGFPRQWNLKDHMKRVHNDHGVAVTSPTGNAPGSQPSKGRKRKTEGSPTQGVSSRKSTQKNMPPKEPKQPAAKPLMDQWMDHYNAIEESIRSLPQPEDARTMHQITEMQKRLGVLAQVTSEINAVSVVGFPMPDGSAFEPTG